MQENNISGGSLVPLIMDKCFEKYFGNKDHKSMSEAARRKATQYTYEKVQKELIRFIKNLITNK